MINEETRRKLREINLIFNSRLGFHIILYFGNAPAASHLSSFKTNRSNSLHRFFTATSRRF